MKMENSVEDMGKQHNGKEDSYGTITKTISDQNHSDEEYDPYLHRNVKHATTYFETLIHLMKCSMGTGVLAMPSAFANAGYVVGTLGTFIIGFLCTYTVHILIASEYELCKRNKKASMSYPETSEAALLEGPGQIKKIAKYAPFVCNLFLLMYEIGSSGAYIVFISSNLKDVVDHYQAPEDRYGVRIYCVIVLIPLLLINSIRNYKYLAPLSTVGTILSTISYAIILYYLFSEMPDVTGRHAAAPINRIPLFFGIVVFSIEAIAVVFPLENEMKNPKDFRSPLGVINCAMVPITFIFACVGLFGYLRYGENVAGSITLSLPPDKIFSQAVRIMIAIAIFISHALMLHPAIDILWYDYLKKYVSQRQIFWEHIVRVSTVLITFCLAIAVPYLDLFISLIGALCMSTLGLMFPAIIQTFTLWNNYNGLRFSIFFFKNFIITVIAVYGLSLGVKTSIEGIIEKIAQDMK